MATQVKHLTGNAYVVHGITGSFKGTVSVWVTDDRFVDAEQRTPFGSTDWRSRTVSADSPIGRFAYLQSLRSIECHRIEQRRLAMDAAEASLGELTDVDHEAAARRFNAIAATQHAADNANETASASQVSGCEGQRLEAAPAFDDESVDGAVIDSILDTLDTFLDFAPDEADSPVIDYLDADLIDGINRLARDPHNPVLDVVMKDGRTFRVSVSRLD